MGAYNTTVAMIACPRCAANVECTIALYFGNISQMVGVQIGSVYPFLTDRAPQNGGALLVENPYGMGYTECPRCRRDFHCIAEIQNGILRSITVDHEHPPLIADRAVSGCHECPDCGGTDTCSLYFNGYTVGRIVCQSPTCSCVVLFRHGRDDAELQLPYLPAINPVRNN